MKDSKKELRNKVIRIFISSTFEDMKKERDILQEKVYPYLVGLCTPQGWQIEFVDLRWGISKEAGVQQKTMKICLEELQRCRKVSPRPNFLILQGQRYGWCPLPDSIKEDYWGPLMALAEEKNVDELLRDSYRIDRNSIPVTYELKSKASYGEKHYDEDFLKYEEEVERPLHDLMVDFVTRNSGMPEADKPIFIASATEQEILHGAMSDDVLPQQVAAYFRTVTDLDYDEEYEKLLDRRAVREQNKRSIARLKQHIADRLSEVEGAVKTREITKKEYWSDEYLKTIEEDLKQLLKGLVENEIRQYEESKWQPWEIEKFRQNEFVELRTKHFKGREGILKKIMDFVRGEEILFCLEGRSGTGKSTVMAKVYQKIDKDQYIAIFRSVGVGSSTSGEAILRTILQQLQEEYKVNLGEDDLGRMSYAELTNQFSYLLHEYKGSKRIVLLIDALDQLPKSDPLCSFDWLPHVEECRIRVIVSRICEDDTNALPSESSHTLENMSNEGDEAAKNILLETMAEANRTLTQEQQAIVLQAYKDGGSRPLFLKLIAGIAAGWHDSDTIKVDSDSSYKETIENGKRTITISPNEAKLVEGFFRMMEDPSRHGQIVNNVLAFIYLTRRGLSDGELRRLLALDEEFMDIFRKNSYHDFKPVVDAFPSIIWTRLYYDIKFLLSDHIVTGGAVNTFNHRQVSEGARLFLENGNPNGFDKSRVFRLLMVYFGERYRMKDLRALEELPRVLKKSGRMDDLATLLLDIDYIQLKAANGLTFDLIKDFAVAINELNSRINPLTTQDIAALILPQQYSKEFEKLLDQAVLKRYCNRLQAVQEFVVKELDKFIYFAAENDLFTLQLFYNAYDDGPLTQMAELYRDAASSNLSEMYLRTNRPAYPRKNLVMNELTGHSWCVTSVRVSPDGKTAITAADDRLCKVWDMTHLCVLRTFFGHHEQVSALAVSNDFSEAYSGSWNGEVLHWEVETANKIHYYPMVGGRSKVTALEIDPAGGCRVGYENGRCVHLNNGRRTEYASFEATVTALSRIGDNLYAGIDNGSIYDITCVEGEPRLVAVIDAGVRTIAQHGVMIWASNAKGELYEINPMTGNKSKITDFDKPQTNNPTDYRFSTTPDGRWIAAIADTNICLVENPLLGNSRYTLKEHSKDINDLTLMSDAKRLFSVGRDRRLIQWNLENLKYIDDLAYEKYPRWFDKLVSTSKQTTRMEVVAASTNGNIVRWRSKDPRGKLLKGNVGPVFALDVSSDGHSAICAIDRCDGEGSFLQIVDIDSQEQPIVLDKVHKTYINAVRFSPSGRYAVSNAIDSDGSGKGTILVLWDIARKKAIKCYTEEDITGSKPPKYNYKETDPGKNPDTHRYKISNITPNTPLGNIIHINAADGVAWSPCGRYVAVACRSNIVSLFDPFDGRRVKLLGICDPLFNGNDDDKHWHLNEVKAVAFSPDGRRLFSGSWDNSIIIWDLSKDAGDEFVVKLKGHTRGVYSLDVAPDGKTLVSGANDHSFIIWDVERAIQLANDGKNFVKYQDKVVINRVVGSANCDAVAFTQDGVVAGLDNGDVMVTENSKGETLRSIPFATPTAAYDAFTGEQQEPTVHCPCCGSSFKVPNHLLALTRESYSILSVNHSEADPERMITTCPKCHNNMYLTPFSILQDGSGLLP